MREIPILFNSPMVRANRAGLKWQTRRRIKPQPELRGDTWYLSHKRGSAAIALDGMACHAGAATYAPWRVGDTLWARESGWQTCAPSWQQFRDGADTWPKYAYDADGLTENDVDDFKAWGWKRRPSIHMPRWACRDTYTVTGVRAERVRDISEDDAIAEGIQCRWVGGSIIGHFVDLGIQQFFYSGGESTYPSARQAYAALYESINGPGSFERDDWVWVVEYDNPARSK